METNHFSQKHGDAPCHKLLSGKRGLIFGLANDHSIAWGISKALADHGAELAFTYQGPVFHKRVEPLAKSLGSSLLFPCDVGQEGDVEKVFAALSSTWDSLDFVVHSIAYSEKEELRGSFLDTSRSNFLKTMDISCYSFIEVTKHATPLMKNGGSVLTLSYYGAEKVIPHYNVMGVAKAALEASVRYLADAVGPYGIRVNAISAGPIKTLAASGIGDFGYILRWTQENSPLRCGVSIEDVGQGAVYLLSPLSKSVTGNVHYIDGGYHVIGMKGVHSEDFIQKLADK